MRMKMGSTSGASRRAVLAGTAGAVAATSGCLGEIRNIAGRQPVDQLSLRISTVPASKDPYAIQIANHLAGTLEQSGIDVMVDPMSPDVLRRETLVNFDFDLYVDRYPSGGNLDELRSMLHSAYGEESGWQNPFGFSNLDVDELLDEQRTSDHDERVEIGRELQRRVVEYQPFTVVCFPDRIDAIRNDRFEGWPGASLTGVIEYLQLDRVGETAALELLLGDDHVTRNRNPIAVEYRDRGNLIGLLYDPLVRRVDDAAAEPIPWLARSIEWDDTETAATVRLRETPWHDGEPLTAEDVAFTYQFLADTSLGRTDIPVPTPLNRGRLSLVENVRVQADDALRFEFTTANRAIARRALGVPILPEHVWRERAGPADLAGVELSERTTEALVTPNEDAIGSGPFRFEAATTGESLSLVRFDEHFSHAEEIEQLPVRVTENGIDRILFTVSPSDDATVEILVENEADASVGGLRASVVPKIVQSDDVSLAITSSSEFYHVGYNCRRSPITDPRFRRAVARHLDRGFLVETALNGYGTPAEAPIRGQWLPEELQWDGEASLPFFGDAGELDVEAAREAFREAGYQYDGERLIRRAET
jgi:peptide/nickel transport system substrate-binding protein